MAKAKLISTGDGSHSLYIREMNETYHSTHGALTESQHVFLKEGVLYFLKEQSTQGIRILEVGFGTGLNALMMLDYAKGRPALSIDFFTLEPFPLDKELYSQLNFADLLPHVTKEELQRLHQIASGDPITFENFCFSKSESKVEEAELKTDVDVVFFDAFAPNKQAEVWDVVVLEKMHDCLTRGGVLVTYCAQGQFKRNLKAVGFEVETLKGPPGKKEMVRGLKI